MDWYYKRKVKDWREGWTYFRTYSFLIILLSFISNLNAFVPPSVCSQFLTFSFSFLYQAFISNPSGSFTSIHPPLPLNFINYLLPSLLILIGNFSLFSVQSSIAIYFSIVPSLPLFCSLILISKLLLFFYPIIRYTFFVRLMSPIWFIFILILPNFLPKFLLFCVLIPLFIYWLKSLCPHLTLITAPLHFPIFYFIPNPLFIFINCIDFLISSNCYNGGSFWFVTK